MLRHWNDRRLTDLLAEHGLTGAAETPFPNDGWSGAKLTALERGGRRFILKRTSPSIDWIARATADESIREAVVAAGHLPLPNLLRTPYLGAAADGEVAAILMPDLSDTLIAWDRGAALPEETLLRVISGIVELHVGPWLGPRRVASVDLPWTPIRRRLALLDRRSAEGYVADGVDAGRRFLAGWAAFDRFAPRRARELVEKLTADLDPLLRALDRLPATLIHGDLKLGNVALLPDGRMALIDWQMVMRAPVAVELGWFLVANSGSLGVAPDAALQRYRSMMDARCREAGEEVIDGDPAGDWGLQVDLAWIVGLILRGWRKGLDAEAGLRLPSGVPAGEDLQWWAQAAVDAAERRL